MITWPRLVFAYPDRWLECQQALEPVLLELFGGYDIPYIDPVTISGPIFDAGYKARWGVSDIAAAVEELAVNRQLAMAANRAFIHAICDALTRTSRH